MLSRDEVVKISRLARLSLSDAEIEDFRSRLGRVLEYVHELEQVQAPTEAIVQHVPKDAVSFRNDQPMEFGAKSHLMMNSPATENNQFLLPKIVDHA